MPKSLIASVTSVMAALFASSASRALAASRMTVSDNSAMSGATLASPSPVTTIRGWTGGSAADATAGIASTAAASPSAIIRLFIEVSPSFGFQTCGKARLWMQYGGGRRRKRIADALQREAAKDFRSGTISLAESPEIQYE